MKKLLLILSFFALLLGVTSCKSDDNNTPSYTNEQIVGEWEHSSTKVYNQNKKFLGEVPAKVTDTYQCGNIRFSYTLDKITASTFKGRDADGKCIEDVSTASYKIEGNYLVTTEDSGLVEKVEITRLAKKTMSLMVKLPKPEIGNGIEIHYTELIFKRIK